MKKMPFMILSMLFVALLIGPSEAQQPNPLHRPIVPTLSSQADVNMTPEMWFYEQYQVNYANPRARVHQNAALRARQRTARIESAKWYGISNSRPTLSSDPIHADSGPRWTSGNMIYPNRWVSQGARPWVIISTMTP